MYSSWNLCQLKAELKRRGASLRGKKIELVERLELYDRNFDFGHIDCDENEDPSMELPDLGTYRDINSSTLLPPVHALSIRIYFACADKKLNESKTLYECRHLLTARASTVGDFTFIKGFCKKTMKKLQYEVDIKIHKNGTIEESHCECPAGSGINAKCKHVAVLLYGVQDMFDNKSILLEQVCTQQLQAFHVPKKQFNASPIVAQNLPKKRSSRLFTPYPTKTMNKKNYNNRVRNLILNFQPSSMPLKHLYAPANPHALVSDPSYTSHNAEEEVLKKLKLLDVDDCYIQNIEKVTRNQIKSTVWHEERMIRLTASKFHTICHLKDSSKMSYSKQLLINTTFTSRATTHGILNESVALELYMAQYNLDVNSCGLFIAKDRPFLGASPDGLLGDETIVEVKCPFSSRHQNITPVTVPYIIRCNNGLTLKKTTPYYYQVQGQLYCTKRKFCNFIIYTYKEIKVLYVSRDDEFIKEMLDKLDSFYHNFFKVELLKEHLYHNYYDTIKNKHM